MKKENLAQNTMKHNTKLQKILTKLDNFHRRNNQYILTLKTHQHLKFLFFINYVLLKNIFIIRLLVTFVWFFGIKDLTLFLKILAEKNFQMGNTCASKMLVYFGETN